VTAARAEQIAARFAERLSGDMISKRLGSTVTAADMMPAARLVSDAEDRLDALRLASADIGARIEALRLMDPPSPLRPSGAAGPIRGTDDLLSEIDRVLSAPALNGVPQ
jgi:hypothetical protein